MPGTNGSGSAFAVAEPVVTIDNQDNASLAAGLASMLIVESVSGLYRCEATFGNWGPVDNGTGFLYFDRQLLDFGKAFKIKLGSDTLFDGKIMALEAKFPEGQSPTLTVLA